MLVSLARELERAAPAVPLSGLRARLLLHRGRPADAREVVRTARAALGDDPELIRIELEAAQVLNDRDAMRAAYEQLSARSDCYGLYGQAFKELAERGRERGALEKAIDLLDRSAAAEPTFAPAYGMKATILAPLAGRSPSARDQAKAAAERAIELDPTSPESFYARSYVTWAQIATRLDQGATVPVDEQEVCADDLRVAHALQARPVFLIYVGKLYSLCGRPREALAPLEAAIAEAQPGAADRAFGLSYRAVTRLLLGDEAGAVEDWSAAVRAGPLGVLRETWPYAQKLSADAKRRLVDVIPRGQEGDALRQALR
jgi:tetratricopeptide (TPR) repeat protein